MEEDRARQAQLFMELAKAAQGRFYSRRDVEWKVTIGVWAFFGAAIASVITAKDANPGWGIFTLATIFVLLFLVTYRFKWLVYLARAFRRDHYITYYWESGVQLLLNRAVPTNIDPAYSQSYFGNSRTGGWVRMEDCPLPGASCGALVSSELSDSQVVQFRVTVAFALLFLLVLASRITTPTVPTATEGKNRVAAPASEQVSPNRNSSR